MLRRNFRMKNFYVSLMLFKTSSEPISIGPIPHTERSKTVGHEVFRPKTAVREEKRQANEALGRSFCKTIAEPVTNADSSAKRKLKIEHSSGLVDLMLAVPKGTELNTSALRAQLEGKYPKRAIVVELVTAKTSGRTPGEVVVVDQAEGMSAHKLREALDEIGGNKLHLSAGVMGRNLFGRGLSDVMRAHTGAVVQTFDGNQLTIAHGKWDPGWTIEMDYVDAPGKHAFKKTFLDPATTGTAIRFVIGDRKRCHIPDPPDIAYRLYNFYMLRLIASDPNVNLILRQYRAAGCSEQRLEYDFPVGQVIESTSRTFDISKFGANGQSLTVDFVVFRSDSERIPRGLGLDRDGRENGLVIVDDLDAVYDLTFADPDYEKADFLSHIFGVVRVNGLRKVLEAYLEADSPTSPLRPDRDGFNRDHEFSRALLEFIANSVRPLYERERKRAEEQHNGALSSETKKRIDDALKQLNKYFQRITQLSGPGLGIDNAPIPEPSEPVSFFPRRTKLVAGRPHQVLLLIREDIIKDGAEVVASASDGFSVQPETERVDKKNAPRWQAHNKFIALRFSVTCSEIGKRGHISAVIEGKEGDLIEATLQIEDVLAEPLIELPETLEFRPKIATGRPGRRNNLVLYVNPKIISPGHYVRVRIIKRIGSILLIDAKGSRVEEIDMKLDAVQHRVKGQTVLRVLIPWGGTSWNQHARVEARVKVGGPQPLTAEASIRLDEPEDGGFFKDVKYGEIDPRAPSQFAAGVITVNDKDQLNRLVFGDSQAEFDKRVSSRIEAQQRLATLLLEEASFRALQQRYDENKVLLAQGREVGAVHEEVDKYKFESAADVYRALARSRF
jgi:hypothetical protein